MSRFADHTPLLQRVVGSVTTWVSVCIIIIFIVISPSGTDAGLYKPTDQIVVLNPRNVDAVLLNASAAVVAEFYVSWCGHCVQFSPVYKSLARDIRGAQKVICNLCLGLSFP